MKQQIMYHRINIDDFYHAIKQPSKLLIPYGNGFTLKVKMDMQNNEFTVYEPHTVVTIERLYNDAGAGGFIFFQCPSCNKRKKHLFRTEKLVKCSDCFTVDEIMSGWE